MAWIVAWSGLVGVKPRHVAVVLALAAVYFATARLGLVLALPPEKKATAVSPPSGIALAALLLWGYRVWPGVWLGAFLANMLDYFNPDNPFSLLAHLLVSAGIATGSTLQALAGNFLVQRWIGPGSPFDRASHVFTFAGVAMLMCVIAATCGVASLYLGGFAPGRAVGFIWWTWWIGDMTGVLTVGAFVLTWSRMPRFVWEPRQLAEAALLLVLLLTVASAIFGIISPVITLPPPLAYLTVPFLVWATFRFGLHGAATTLFLLSAVAVLATARGTGPFSQPSIQTSLLLLQVFMGVVAVTALVMAAVLNEHHGAEKMVRESEERYRVLTDALPHMVWSMRPDLTLEFLNNRSSEFTGLSVEQVNAQGWSRRVHPDDLPRMMAAVSGPLERGEAHEVEYRFLHRSGEYRWVVSRAVPIKESGIVLKWVGSTNDIHDRKVAEEALRASERRFRVVVEAFPSGIVLIGRDGTIVLVNAPLEQMFGYADRELLGQAIERLLPERDRDRHPALRGSFFDTPKARVMGSGRDLRGLRKDGSEFPVEVGLQPVEMGDDLFVLASVIDITPRKQAEAALQASERRFRLLLEGLPQLIWTCSADGRCDFLGRQWVEYTGVPEADHLGYGWAEAVHPDDRPLLMEQWRQAIESGGPFDVEFRLRGRSGEYRWFKTRAVLLEMNDGNCKWFGTNTDIHVEKKTEEELKELNATLERRVAERTEALRESERRFRAIFHSQFQFIGLMTPDGILIEANRTALASAGETEESVLGKPFWETPWWTHDLAQQDQLREAVRRAAGGEQVRFEASHPTADGPLIWVDFSLTPFFDDNGKVVLLIPEGRDITQRKRSEGALREQEERFRSAFDYAPIGIALVAPDGKWLRVNRSLCEIVGYSERELLATNFQSITHPDDLEADLGHVREMLAGTIRSYQMEKRYFHKQGHIVHILLSVSLVRDGEGAPLYFISQIKDITRQKQAERQMVASLREKEVLLKEIHHRVKNNLQIISTLLDLQSEHTQDQQVRHMFEESRGRVKAMALIHERLYRSQDLARVHFDQYIRRLADDLCRTYKVFGEIALDVECDVPSLPIDTAIPCGLLINELLSNCLKHAFKCRTEGKIRVALHSNEGGSVLSVADDGVGFPAEIDFRNTTSFGLQLVNTLAEQLRGRIELKNERGAEFIIWFPKRDD